MPLRTSGRLGKNDEGAGADDIQPKLEEAEGSAEVEEELEEERVEYVQGRNHNEQELVDDEDVEEEIVIDGCGRSENERSEEMEGMMGRDEVPAIGAEEENTGMVKQEEEHLGHLNQDNEPTEVVVTEEAPTPVGAIVNRKVDRSLLMAAVAHRRVPRLAVEEGSTTLTAKKETRKMVRITSPPRTRSTRVHAEMISSKGDGEEDGVLLSMEGRLADADLDESAECVCNSCGAKWNSRAELYEHKKARHPRERDLPRIFGTLMCAHPHCGATFPDLRYLLAHLIAFHCQVQFRIRPQQFSSIEHFENWKMNSEETNKCTFISAEDEKEVSPGVFQLELYCACCDEWRACDKTKLESPLVGCPAHMTVTIDKNKDKVSVVGCMAHLGHFKKPNWSMMNQTDLFRPKQHLHHIRMKCNACQKWFRSRSALSSHRRVDHPETTRMPALQCGDPSCDTICDTMLALCEHVADVHKREDLVVEEYRFSSLSDFELWKERMEADTMAYYTKVSGRQRAATHGPNADCFFRYYQCHLSGYVQRPSQRMSQELDRPKIRNRATKKLGRYCTAFMNIKINESDGSVLLKGCLGHFGHETDIRRVPVPLSVRAEIAELLQKGVAEDDVLAIIKNKSAPHERAFYLQKYEVKNIVKKLMRESNGALYYKYDDDPEEALPEEEEEAMWESFMRRPDNISNRFLAAPPSSSFFRSVPKRRSTGTFAMQFGLAASKRRRLAYRSGAAASHLREDDMLQVEEVENVGAMEEFYEDEGEMTMGPSGSGMGAGPYLRAGHMAPPPGAAGVRLEDRHHVPEQPLTRRLRKLIRMPLLRDTPPDQEGSNHEFDSVLQSIQTKIKVLSEQVKRTKDLHLAASMLEEVRTLEGRMTRLVSQIQAPPPTSQSRWTVKKMDTSGYYEVEEEELVEFVDDQPCSSGEHPQYEEVYETVASPGMEEIDVEDIEEEVVGHVNITIFRDNAEGVP